MYKARLTFYESCLPNFSRRTQRHHSAPRHQNTILNTTTSYDKPKMPTKIHLIRHAQGEHNLTVRYSTNIA
jgi:hypothetical protein